MSVPHGSSTSTTTASTTTSTSTTTVAPSTTSTTTTEAPKTKKVPRKPDREKRPKSTTTTTTPAFDDDYDDEDDDDEDDDDMDMELPDNRLDESENHEPPPVVFASTKLPPPYGEPSSTARPEYDDDVDVRNPYSEHGNDVSMIGQKPDDRPSFFAQPGILAGKLVYGAPACPAPVLSGATHPTRDAHY